jgi:hypothetical protein
MATPDADLGQENRTQPAPVLVRMPPDLKARLKACAEQEHRSLSGQVVVLLERALGSTAA